MRYVNPYRYRGTKTYYFAILYRYRGTKTYYFSILYRYRGTKIYYFAILYWYRGMKTYYFVILYRYRDTKTYYFAILYRYRGRKTRCLVASYRGDGRKRGDESVADMSVSPSRAKRFGAYRYFGIIRGRLPTDIFRFVRILFAYPDRMAYLCIVQWNEGLRRKFLIFH